MEGKKESLEERAKEFFKLRIDFKGFNPIGIDNLYEYISEINYLVERRYVREIGDTVKTFCYVSTVEGRKWAKS